MVSKFPKKLADMGYTEEGLDADNPYTQGFSSVFGELPEPIPPKESRKPVDDVAGFHHAMPLPRERINICARTYGDARTAHKNMMQRGECSAVFYYIGVAQQMQNLRGCGGCRLFTVSGWSRLMDAPMIEQLAKAYRVEIVNYEIQ